MGWIQSRCLLGQNQSFGHKSQGSSMINFVEKLMSALGMTSDWVFRYGSDRSIWQYSRVLGFQ